VLKLTVWRARAGASFPLSKFSIMYLIGVIPAIGSLEKGNVKATAPTSFPSM